MKIDEAITTFAQISPAFIFSLCEKVVMASSIFMGYFPVFTG